MIRKPTRKTLSAKSLEYYSDINTNTKETNTLPLRYLMKDNDRKTLAVRKTADILFSLVEEELAHARKLLKFEPQKKLIAKPKRAISAKDCFVKEQFKNTGEHRPSLGTVEEVKNDHEERQVEILIEMPAVEEDVKEVRKHRLPRRMKASLNVAILL